MKGISNLIILLLAIKTRGTIFVIYAHLYTYKYETDLRYLDIVRQYQIIRIFLYKYSTQYLNFLPKNSA